MAKAGVGRRVYRTDYHAPLATYAYSVGAGGAGAVLEHLDSLGARGATGYHVEEYYT